MNTGPVFIKKLVKTTPNKRTRVALARADGGTADGGGEITQTRVLTSRPELPVRTRLIAVAA